MDYEKGGYQRRAVLAKEDEDTQEIKLLLLNEKTKTFYHSKTVEKAWSKAYQN